MEIFGTLGPACSDREMLVRMFKEGMTGIRLNLSHTSLKDAGALISVYREAAELAGCEAQLLIDLQGPELRIGTLERPVDLAEGDEVTFCLPDETGSSEGNRDAAVKIPAAGMILRELAPGDRVLLDDGRIEAEVTRTDPVTASVLRGGKLQSRKSLKIEGKYVDAPVLTDMDLRNLRDARQMGVTAVMQPFVRSGEDLRQLRKALHANGAEGLRIFAKIENMEGVRAVRDILPEADMIVIARGDLGNDMPLWKLPAVQKQLSRECREAGVPFLVVTQMLTSMIGNAVPTRAEVSDIFNAVLDGAEAVMVTNETAVGRYPAEVIRYLTQTCREAADHRDGRGDL